MGGAPLLGRAAENKPAGEPLPADAPRPGVPTVTALTQDCASVAWGVACPCTGFVEYGPTPELGRVAYGARDGLRPYDTTGLALRLTGLTPGRRVYYRTVTAPIRFPNHYSIRRGEAVASPVFDFLPPAAGDSAKIAVWNDVHQQPKTLEALAGATDAFAPDLLVLNGDFVADQFSKEKDFGGTFFGLDSGSPAWPRRPVCFVRGNHDARGPLAREISRFSPRPEPAGYQGLLRLGPVAILRLDTGDDKEGPGVYGDLGDFAAYREEQRLWLEQAVRTPAFASAPFKVLFCHIPLRWKHPDAKGDWCADGDGRWSPVLARAGVRAVISGHTHEFWHSAPQSGRPFHQVVSGGPLLTSNGWSPTPACLVTLEASPARMRLRVVEAVGGKEHLNLEFTA